MPIQFDCPHCSRLIQTPDGTEGKQAKCPSCGNVTRIPALDRESDGSESDGIDVSQIPSHSSFADSNYFRDDDLSTEAKQPPQFNPYATPQSMQSSLYHEDSGLPRTGPPWERDGTSVQAFKDTLLLTLTKPQQMFGTMRLTGNLGSALTMLVIMTIVTNLVGMVYQTIFHRAAVNFGNFGNVFFQAQGITIFQVILTIFVGPVFIVIAAFIVSGVLHVFLIMFQAANQPYETTLRTYCYVTSAAALCQLIPLVGPFANMVVSLIYLIIGLTGTHEAPSGRVAAAVVAPFLVCCGLCGGIMFFGIMAGAAGPAFR
jgi:hypothetical protein